MSMPSAGPTFELLLATCNGARFLPALLDSVLAQDFGPFAIIARDDRSDDATRDILERYRSRLAGRMRILPPPEQRGGACSNFGALIAAAEADFVFLCDQDDVWLPDKMARTYEAMAQLAARSGGDRPLLVHTDLAVAGPRLEALGASYFRYAGIDPGRKGLGDLLLSNVATGCTILANRSLYSTARPIPDAALMHDHWLAQVAAALGEIAVVPSATMLYRQHGGNVIGVEKATLRRFLGNAGRTLFTDAVLGVLRAYSRHAEVLLARYGDRLDRERREQVSALAGIWELPRHRRFLRLWRAGVRKPTFAGNVALFLLLLRNGNEARAARA
jgi:glycosyltransferase involved in cell wall biosynthesis